MTTQRFFAIVLIFLVASTAWVVLSRTLDYRTRTLEDSLGKEVNGLWGPANLVQNAPYATNELQGKGQSVQRPDPVESQIEVHFEHHNRYKGLLWFSTYEVGFSGKYLIDAPGGRQPGFVFELPKGANFFDKVEASVDGKPVEAKYKSGNPNSLLLVALPVESDEDRSRHEVKVSFRTRGRDSWRYSPSRTGKGPVQIEKLSLTATTNFREIDYLAESNCASPNKPAKPLAKGEGMQATWELEKTNTSQSIGLKMPIRANAGPIASRMSAFAPVSLLFFFTVLFTVVVLKKVALHPMHYMFISAGFFAFHILLAYLVDVMNLQAAFWICAGVSVFLVVSYMRLVAGVKFGMLFVGMAQLVYLIGFSYAFLLEGSTGRIVVVTAVITLFLLMQATGKVDWEQVFAERRKQRVSARAYIPPPAPPSDQIQV